MANILTETLPTKIQTKHGIFEPVTDFRAGVEFEIMAENGEENPLKLFKPYYPNGIPKEALGAIEAAFWLYRCGETERKTDKPIRNTKQAYSYAADSAVIYADFLRYYQIDLSTAELHWWRFRELLFGLPTDSTFKERMYYRTCDTKALSKNERKRVLEIRKLIEIKSPSKVEKITLEERNKQMIDYVISRNKPRR